jgi:outer membrane protein
MKNITTIAILMVTALNANAKDLIIGSFEYNNWQSEYSSYSDIKFKDSNYFGKATVELEDVSFPNFHYSFSSVDYEDFSYIQDNMTFYYEVYDENNITLDLGVGITYISNGKLYNDEFDAHLFNLYAGTEITIPDTDLTVFSNITVAQLQSSSVIDFILGAGYHFDIMQTTLCLQVGFKYQNFKMKDFDNITNTVKSDGLFLGLIFNY